MIDNRLLNKTWRMNHLYSIVNKDKKKIKFKLNEAQTHYNLHKHTRNIILKSRQLGFTTYECVDTLDDCLFNRNFEASILSYNIESAIEIFDTKINFVWLNVPEAIQDLYSLDSDTTRRLKFNFGDGSSSSLSVKTSARSGTKSRIHISEFGKICMQYPAKAKEIISGTIPSVPLNGRIDIESTAEGQEGYFYDMFIEAMGKEPTNSTEFKGHFYNWTWDKEEISKVTTIIKELPKEFLILQKDYLLTDQEITYYYLKWLSLGKNWDLLKQEYPTTWEEAFETSIDGSYFFRQLEQAKNEHRITRVPYNPDLLVDTWWDLGRDGTAIWFTQSIGDEIRVIDYYQREGESIQFYIKELKNKSYTYGKHNGPHDLEVKEYTRDNVSRLEVAKGLGITFIKVPNLAKEDQIQAARTVLSRCWFDVIMCEEGLKHLKNYKKEWDEKRGVWKDTPNHNEHSHGADAFEYMAIGHRTPKKYDEKKIFIEDVPTSFLDNYFK